MKKIIALSLAVILLFTVAAKNAYVVTEWKGNDGTFETPISIKTPVYLKNTPVKIYCTFDDKEQAVKEIRSKCSNVLSFLMEEFNMTDEINDKNWHQYEDYMLEYYGRPVSQDVFDGELDLLDSFFDIYENDELNKRALLNYINEKIFERL